MAGAFSVATAGSAAAATWPQGASRPPAGGGHDTSSVPLAAADQLTQPQGQWPLTPVNPGQALRFGPALTVSQAPGMSQAPRIYQVRDMDAQLIAFYWQAEAAKAPAAKTPAPTAAAAAAAAAAQPTTTAQPRTTAQPGSSPTAATVAAGSPQQIAEAMLGSFGWSSSQFSCLDPLWAHESGWSVTAYNAGSGAYGIPQALPGSRMASAGPDWQTNAATQIRWGLEYIKSTYGSPCAAWDHEQATGWY